MAPDDPIIPSSENIPLSDAYELEASEELKVEIFIVSCISWGLLILATVVAIYLVVQAQYPKNEFPQMTEFQQKV